MQGSCVDRNRCVYRWATFLWFFYSNAPMITMLHNERNMCLETIGALFLFPRSDVSEVRRLTSESNEHTYGMRRMILHEFNMEQLIRIFWKNYFCICNVSLKVISLFQDLTQLSRAIKVRYLISNIA